MSRGAAPAWHLLTGEYPPQVGGVADYSALVAAGLAARGDEVHVWTCRDADAPPGGPEAEAGGPGRVAVHRVGSRWSGPELRALGEALERHPGPRRLLVQYVPNAWGYRGLNVGFCRWLLARRRGGDRVRTMIHEVAYPFRLRERPQRWVLAAGHRLMLRIVLAASERADYSMARTASLLRLYGAGLPGERAWLPVPSTVPRADEPGSEAVAALRRRLAPGGESIVGTFGTFAWSSAEALRAVLARLLRGRPDRVAVLLGRGGRAFAEALASERPELAGRLIAPDAQPAEAISRHLLACDVLIQPFSDGVSTRRTSMMAALAHGRPAVTNRGPSTEPLWEESGGVLLVGHYRDAAGQAATVERLLADPAACARLGAAAEALYERRFALERTLEALAGPAAPAVAAGTEPRGGGP